MSAWRASARDVARRRGRPLSVLLSLAAGLTVLGLGIRVLLGVGALSDAPCVDRDSAPGILIVLGCVAAFVVGHLAGYLGAEPDPDELRERPPILPLPASIARRTRHVMRVAVAAFLGVGALVLVYESIGLTNQWGTRPITDYVRCGASVSPWTAGGAAAAASFLVGRWLWYPRRGEA